VERLLVPTALGALAGLASVTAVLLSAGQLAPLGAGVLLIWAAGRLPL
jgi:hypothetical protein